MNIPQFPSCSNPTGTVIASYDQGTHGIVGDTSTHTGSDKVYKINNIQTLQCFCDENQNGIETMWWKIDGLTIEEINTLKNLGWHYVPSGSNWGLDNLPYMAFNNNYLCNEERVLGISTQNTDTPNFKLLGILSLFLLLLLYTYYKLRSR